MKDDKNLLKFQIFSVIFSIILGIILHFLFKWSGNNPIVGIFSSINESTWEHLKLSFFPLFISTIIGYYIFKDDFPNFFCSKGIGIIVAISFVIVFFYIYTGILGENLAILDICSFFVSIILGEFVAYRNIISNRKCNKQIIGLIIGIFFLSFIFFTFSPPKINLFRDPITNTYRNK